MLFLLLQGIYSQLTQAVVLRELISRFAGLELTFVIALSFMLLWTGVGCLLAEKIVTKFEQRFDYILTLLLAASPVVALVQVIALYMLPPFFGSRLGTISHINDLILFSIFIPLPFGLVNGAIFGLITSYKKSRERENNYSIDAFGDMLGGLAFSLFLANFVSPMALLGLFGALFPFMLLFKRQATQRNSWMRLIGLLVIMGSVVAVSFSDSFLSGYRWKNLLPDFSYENSLETPYGRIDILKHYEKGNLKRLEQTVFFKNGTLMGSVPVDTDLDYPAAVWSALQADKRDLRVLISASAFSCFPKIMLELPFIREVDFVNTEERLIQEAVKLDILPVDNKKMNVISQDCRVYLQQNSKKYDLIMVLDESPDTFAGNRFFTKQFYQLVAANLLPDGVFVTQMQASGGYSTDMTLQYNKVIINTLKTSFRNLTLTPGIIKYIASGNGDNISSNLEIVDKRMELLMPHFSSFPPGMMEVSFSQSAQKMEMQCLADVKGNDVVNSDAKPILPIYYLNIFAHESAGSKESPGGVVGWINQWNDYFFFIVFVIVIIYLVLRVIFLAQKQAPGLLTFENGFYAMGIEMTLLILYQNQCGTLYQNIAAALGVFIGGTAFGAMLKPGKIVKWIHCLCIIYMIVLLIPDCLHGSYFSVFIFAGFAVCGASVGAMYRQLCSKSTFSLNWAWEVIGGGLGGLITALYLLPSWGNCVIILFILMRIVGGLNIKSWQKRLQHCHKVAKVKKQ